LQLCTSRYSNVFYMGLSSRCDALTARSMELSKKMRIVVLLAFAEKFIMTTVLSSGTDHNRRADLVSFVPITIVMSAGMEYVLIRGRVLLPNV
jgi:hypothetical protein